MRIVATAPASLANVGPGFDCLAAAISMDLCVIADTEANAQSVQILGEGAGELPTGPDNLVLRAASAVCGDLPALDVQIRSQIPLARGLGSSAAAIAGGLLLGCALDGRHPDPSELLDIGLQMEKHPDNLSAALFGGLVVAVPDGASTRVLRLEPGRTVRPVVLVPEAESLSTEEARAVLPDTLQRSDAVSNAAWAAGLVALLSARVQVTPELLLACTQDRIHQAQRAALMPRTAEAIERLRSAGIAACLSGAGPSVVCLVIGAGEDAVREVAGSLGGWRVEATDWEARGARAEMLDGRLGQ